MSKEMIRKAVELADGFHNGSDAEGDYVEMDQTPLSLYLDGWSEENDQWFLDALAAQLVRQVDALGHMSFMSMPTTVSIHFLDAGESPESIMYHDADCKDRTMNTIKAIIDSGVLDE